MKFLLLILGALLFVQLAHPLPVADSSSSSEEENTPREIFFKDAFKQLFDLFTDSLKGVSQVFQNVVDTARHVENQSEELKKHLANFTEFISNVKDVTESDEKLVKALGVIGLLDEMVTISEAYEKAGRDDPEAFPEKLSLEENGLIEFKKKTLANFVEFERKFRQTLDAYVAGLTSEEAEKENKFTNWYIIYKSTDDMEKKVQFLSEFFDLYE